MGLQRAIGLAYRFTEPGHFPFALGIAFLAFAFAYRSLGLPSPDKLLPIAQAIYQQYGAIALFIAAFLEAVFFLGYYFPGSLVIVLAVLLSPKSPVALAMLGLTVGVGFLAAGVFNYWLGRYGFYRALLWMGKDGHVSRMRAWLERWGWAVLLLTAVHPNWLAISFVAMGISRERLAKTIAAASLGLLVWISIWTVVWTRFVSTINLADRNQHWYVFSVFVVWGIVLIGLHEWRKHKIELPSLEQ